MASAGPVKVRGYGMSEAAASGLAVSFGGVAVDCTGDAVAAAAPERATAWRKERRSGFDLFAIRSHIIGVPKADNSRL